MSVTDTQHERRAQIRKLSSLLVNQIAAGEVIERPASVLKELVENSIDAGATRISVELEQGGVELIRISDDGHGIVPDQMTLALTPHATSKIEHADDLDRIGTMGFRGEALASITSVARVTIRSRAIGEPEGRIIEAEGDTVGEPRPVGCPVGTTIEVRNLFFNTPARRKFLRTNTTEQTRCLEWLR
ncbi:MAG TPA: DNA mismatch repair protein MutL, partial [Phycisphaerales bacterium]|nr:DNA mismatch repair protein MutL [Phycisphaerales bacterium]